jgi:hypothetical protein
MLRRVPVPQSIHAMKQRIATDVREILRKLAHIRLDFIVTSSERMLAR